MGLPPDGLTPENIIKENIRLKRSLGVRAKAKMTTLIAVLFLLLLFTPTRSFADGWILTTVEFTITETGILPTKNWVTLESFATILQCNDRRSSLIKQIDKERREIKSMEDHSGAIETDRELRLLWLMYTTSKCVSAR